MVGVVWGTFASTPLKAKTPYLHLHPSRNPYLPRSALGGFFVRPGKREFAAVWRLLDSRLKLIQSHHPFHLTTWFRVLRVSTSSHFNLFPSLALAKVTVYQGHALPSRVDIPRSLQRQNKLPHRYPISPPTNQAPSTCDDPIANPAFPAIIIALRFRS